MKKTCIILIVSMISFLLPNVIVAQSTKISNANTFEYEWPHEPEVMQKLKKWMGLKFGVILHWGIYSEPGITESWNLCNEDWVPRDTTKTYQEYKDWYWGLAAQRGLSVAGVCVA